MYYCSQCECEIGEERVKAFFEVHDTPPALCLECAKKLPKPVGFMVFGGGGKGSGKTGGNLLVIDPRNPKFKEQLRQAQRANIRAR